MITPHDLIVRIALVSCVLVGFLVSGAPSMAQVVPPIITPSPGSTLTTTTVTFTGAMRVNLAKNTGCPSATVRARL